MLNPNCTGASSFGAPIDISLTYPECLWTEDDYGLLPTLEPSSPQYEITITEDDFPVWTPFELPHTKLLCMYAGVKNNTFTTTCNVYYRFFKNNGSVFTGSFTVNPNYKGCVSCFSNDVVAGDLFGISLWSSTSSGVTHSLNSKYVVPSRLFKQEISKKLLINMDIVVNIDFRPIGYTGAYIAGSWYMSLDSVNDAAMLPYNKVNCLKAAIAFPEFGVLRSRYGDYDEKVYTYGYSSTYNAAIVFPITNFRCVPLLIKI